LCAHSNLQRHKLSTRGLCGGRGGTLSLPTCGPASDVASPQAGAGASPAAADPHQHCFPGALGALLGTRGRCERPGPSISAACRSQHWAKNHDCTVSSSFHTSAAACRPQIGGYMRTGGRAADAEGHATEPRFLVTGACGQVGQEFVAFLRTR
jgi:hypothetical protein